MIKLKIKSYKLKLNRGITLFIAVTITAILLFVSFAVINVAIKSTLFAASNRESQLAFSAAEAGIECSVYWDATAQPISLFHPGSSTDLAAVSVDEFSGVDEDPLDQTSWQVTSGSGVFDSGSKTTNFAEELIYGYGESGNIAGGSGFTIIATSAYIVREYKNVLSTGSYKTSFSNSIVDERFAAMLTFKAASSQTPTWVNGGVANPAIGSNTVTLDSPSATGNLIIATITYNTVDFIINSLTDNKGNTYIRAIGPVFWYGNTFGTEVWYAKNITGGGAPITITIDSFAFINREIDCNEQTISTGSQTVQTNPVQQSQIGEGGSEDPTSIFQLDFSNGTCAIVEVTKNSDDTTEIRSKGYNTCDTSNARRVERGIEINY